MRSEPVLTSKGSMNSVLSVPWAATLDLRSGALWPPSHVVTCRLSDMAGRYADRAAEQELLNQSDPLIYRADEILAPETRGELHTSVTVVFPGKVGDEYFMSKGHYQVDVAAVKVYLAVSGTGYMLMQNAKGDAMEVPMAPGTIVYCAAGWAQRTVNVGNDPFAYFKYWPADGGHDYERVVREGGFLKRVVERNGRPQVIDAKDI
ncbi:MAG: glucose-6-phosphate isomerase family protein [Mesorhizobium sp.]